MLSETEALHIAQTTLTDRTVHTIIYYQKVYVVLATSNDPEEGDFDPFFAVNAMTGKVSEFSILTDGNQQQISKLFFDKYSV